MIKRNIYKWHRTLSIVIAIPLIMWTTSGIMHPIMSSFKPTIKNQFVKAEAFDTSQIKVNLKDALKKNNIFSIVNFRIVKLNSSYYYQVKLKGNNQLAYISTLDGMLFSSGDEKYAIQLAKQLLGDSSKVTSVNLLENFDDEYVYVNRLLPVYKVNFDRKDGIRIYVDTYGNRLALAMDNGRHLFNNFFVCFHSFGFLNNLGKFRLLVLVVLSSLSLLAAIMGIYIWFIIARKNKRTSEKTKQRRWHGKIAIVTSLTTLMFTFSGAFHAFKKFTPDTRQNYFYEPDIRSENLQIDFNKIFAQLSKKGAVLNVSMISMDGKNYWQITQKGKKNFLVKSYLNTENYSILEKGDEKYASFLSNKFSGNTTAEIKLAEQITKFEGEYGFVNKRLPVVKVQYSVNDNERYYIETSTGKLSAKVQDKDLLEGYSFSMLHKYHFMDFMGKTARDISTIITASANLLVTILGVILFLKFIRNKKSKN